MWPRSLALVVFAVAAMVSSSHAAAASSCSLGLSASSQTSWQVACADQTASGGDAPVVFDPSLLTAVRIGQQYEAVELQPTATTQPTEVHVPVTFAKIGELISPTLTSFSLERDAATTKSKSVAVEIDGSAFTQMTSLQKLSFSYVNFTVASPLQLPPSLNEITIHHAGLVDLKIKAVKGAAFHITKIDLRYNNLRRIPLIIFASKKLVLANLMDNKFLGLRLSRRKLRRLLRLVAAKRILLGDLADFVDACDDGEKKAIRIGLKKYLVCQVEKEDDDELVVDDADGDDGEAGGSVTGSTSGGSSSTTISKEGSSSSADFSVTSAPGSVTPAPSSSSGGKISATSSMAVLAAVVVLALLG